MKKTPLLRNDLFLREGYLLPDYCVTEKLKKAQLKALLKKKKIFLHACMREKKKKKISLAVLPHIFTQINALVKVTNS